MIQIQKYFLTCWKTVKWKREALIQPSHNLPWHHLMNHHHRTTLINKAYGIFFLPDTLVFDYIPEKGVNNQAFVNSPDTVTQPSPPVIIVQQDTEHVPELFEVSSKNWCIFCLTGFIISKCVGCYLGTKYQVGPFKNIVSRIRTLWLNWMNWNVVIFIWSLGSRGLIFL